MPDAVIGNCPVGVYVNPLRGVAMLVPPGPVTVTITVPAPTGAVAVISVAETIRIADEAFDPKSTSVAEVNPMPSIVTADPPPALPLLGEIDVTSGGGITCEAPAAGGLVAQFVLNAVTADKRTPKVAADRNIEWTRWGNAIAAETAVCDLPCGSDRCSDLDLKRRPTM
jgi:hypothetical protein